MRADQKHTGIDNRWAAGLKSAAFIHADAAAVKALLIALQVLTPMWFDQVF